VSQVLVDPNSAAFAEASARLKEHKAKYHYSPVVRLNENSKNWYEVAKLSDPFKDENVVFFTAGVKSFDQTKAICTCDDNFYRSRICFHIVAVWEETNGQPVKQGSKAHQGEIYACSRSSRKPEPVRRCGCGAPAYLDGTRCKACQVEHDAEISFLSDFQLKQDRADLFG
jgi:hypothetical protein